MSLKNTKKNQKTFGASLLGIDSASDGNNKEKVRIKQGWEGCFKCVDLSITFKSWIWYLVIVLFQTLSGKDKAEAQKDRLLEYDQTSEQRTKVIDDESDYFATDVYKWMTPEQKSKSKEQEKELREKLHGSRLDRKIDFDFAGKNIFLL